MVSYVIHVAARGKHDYVALRSLPYFLLGSNKITPQPARGIRWCHEAARTRRHPESLYLLALLHMEGIPGHLEQSMTKSVEYCAVAASQGHGDAMSLLAAFLDRGVGIQEDKAKAKEWWKVIIIFFFTFALAQIRHTSLLSEPTINDVHLCGWWWR
jgi:hypothetical protein